jgi:hypothetical protein
MNVKIHKRFLVVSAALLALLGTSCVGVGVNSYEEFRGAVDSGASCEQLLDIQKNFEGTQDDERVAAELEEIGCDAPDSSRTDEVDR